MANLKHYVYHEELIDGEWVFQGKEPCTCDIGENHWKERPV